MNFVAHIYFVFGRKIVITFFRRANFSGINLTIRFYSEFTIRFYLFFLTTKALLSFPVPLSKHSSSNQDIFCFNNRPIFKILNELRHQQALFVLVRRKILYLVIESIVQSLTLYENSAVEAVSFIPSTG